MMHDSGDQRRATYESLRAQLRVDLLRISEEVAVMPQLIQEAAELAAASAAEENRARHDLDIVTADAMSRLRDGDGPRPRSETRLASDIALEPEVQSARDVYASTKLEAARCEALYRSMRAKSSMVSDACRMIVAGFITPTAFSPARQHLAEGARRGAAE